MVSSVFSPVLTLLMLVLMTGVSAHKDWMDKLPECWKECLGDTSDGCDSSDCICDASQSDEYLPPAVSCVATTCREADYWDIQGKLLVPLLAKCLVDGNAVPFDVATSAEEAASATVTPTFGSGYGTTQRVEDPRPTTENQEGAEMFTTTMTTTTTDDDGRTLQIVVPVVIGPKTTSFGKTAVSTVDAESTATVSSTSFSAPLRPTSEAPSLASTQAQQEAGSSTSSEAAEKTSDSDDNNGSPFENMQAGASHRGASMLIAGLGVFAGVLFGL